MLYHGSDVIRDLEWVIFDEVHYINDSEVCQSKHVIYISVYYSDVCIYFLLRYTELCNYNQNMSSVFT